MARRARSRVWRLLLWSCLGLVVLLVAAITFALDTSSGRAFVQARVNAALASVFQGSLRIERIGSLGLGGLRGVDARVFDPQGKQVVQLRGLSVSAAFPRLVWQLAAHSNHPELVLESVSIDHVDVTLRDDADVGVTLARAFLPRESAPNEPTAPATPAAKGSGPELRIPKISCRHIWAHGTVGGSPPLDVELSRLGASFSQTPAAGLGLEVTSVDLQARALPNDLEPTGKVTLKLALPPESAPMRLRGSFVGRAADSALTAEASLDGDDLRARFEAPSVDSAALNRRFSLQLGGVFAARGAVEGTLPVLSFGAIVQNGATSLAANGYASVSDGVELFGDVTAQHLDFRHVAAGAPESDLGLRAEVVVFETDTGYVGAHQLVVAPGRVTSLQTPALTFGGRESWDDARGASSAGRLRVDDPGASVQGKYELHAPREAGGVVTTSLAARLNAPERLARSGLVVSGRADVDAKLELQEPPKISAKADVSLSQLDSGSVKLRNLRLTASAFGSAKEPHARAEASFDALNGRTHSHLVAALDQRASEAAPRLNAAAHIELARVGALDLRAVDFQLPSSASNPERAVTKPGELSAQGDFSLDQLAPMLAPLQLPIERTAGRVRFQAESKVAKGDKGGPELSATIDTYGLVVVGQREVQARPATTGEAREAQPPSLEGIDLHLSLHCRPATGDTIGVLIVRDQQGTLAELQTEWQPGRLWPTQGLDRTKLLAAPLRATLEIPERELSRLPQQIRPHDLLGRAALSAELEGSAARPELSVRLAARSVHTSISREPIALGAQVDYNEFGGKSRIQVQRAGQQIASVAADWQGDLQRAGRLTTGKSGITGGARVKLSEFPIEVLPWVSDHQLRGRLNGEVALEGFGRDAQVHANLTSTTLDLDKIKVQSFDLAADTGAGKLNAKVALAMGAASAGGTLESELTWGSAPVPSLGRRAAAHFEAKAFDLAAVSPITSEYLSELGGKLDAQGDLVIAGAQTTVNGWAKLRKGVIQAPGLDQQFSDIDADVSLSGPEFRLEQLSARGLTGRVTGNGVATLDGFALRKASAHLAIAKHEQLPVSVEGAPLGDMWGNFDATYTSPPTGTRKLKVDVPVLHLTVPENGNHDLQSLEPPEHVRVGVTTASGRFTPLPSQPLETTAPQTTSGPPPQPLEIHVELGKDVTVERGRTAQAQLAGQLTLETGAATDAHGRIEVRGGKLDVSGKIFEIERGVATFEGDPGNPTVTATARWDAPEYTVYAEYSGDLKDGKIKLHSEPPLSQSEIANLLMFGSPEGPAAGSSQPDPAALAVGVAGSTAAEGLNQLLDDFTQLKVSARVDTTTGSARPELVFQVSPRVSARLTRAVGAPAAGESQDRTFLTLELRLKRSWALSAIFGDRGASALDLIWRRRY